MFKEQISEPTELEREMWLREALDEEANTQWVADSVASHMIKTAFKEFPSLKEMSAKEIIEFGDVVTTHSANFAMRAASIAYAVGKHRIDECPFAQK